MARKKVKLAQSAIAAVGLSECDEGEAVARLMTALRHFCDATEGLNWHLCTLAAERRYNADVASADGCAPVGGYDGWNRIHDDNKAEGRPIGDQWDSSRFYYRGGIKIPKGGR